MTFSAAGITKKRFYFVCLQIISLGILFFLTYLFYYPETNPMESRYSYYPDSFERFANIINPDYSGNFRRYKWEFHSPFRTLLTRASIFLFQDNWGNAVLALHFGTALIASFLTFRANKQFFCLLSALGISMLLLFDRAIMPVVRGLGVITPLFLIPLALIAIHNFARTQDMSRQDYKNGKWLASALKLGVCIAVMYSLGGHETIFFISVLCVFLAFIGIEWVVQKKLYKSIPSGPTLASIAGLVIAVTLILAIFSSTYLLIDKKQERPSSFGNFIIMNNYSKKSLEDIKIEPKLAKTRHLEVLKGTFIEGRYLTEFGSHHENVFLYPGEGFNGIIPLFIFPGFLVGLLYVIKRFISIYLPQGNEKIDRSEKYFIFFLMALFAQFCAIAYLSFDPKPTRYTFCIYAILATSALGYEKIIHKLKAFTEKWVVNSQNNRKKPFLQVLPSGVAFVALLLVFAALTSRLTKNHNDLEAYFEEYRYQLLSITIKPVLEEAIHLPQKLFVIYHPRIKEPAIGMLLGFKVPKNIILIKSRNKVEQAAKRALSRGKKKNIVFILWDDTSKVFKYLAFK